MHVRRQAKRRWTLAAALAIGIVIASGAIYMSRGGSLADIASNLFETAKLYWQRRSVDREWCSKQADLAQPILRAIRAYRAEKGEYPVDLASLVPEHLGELFDPIPHPSGSGGDEWHYRKIGEERLQLSVTACHWISSYDALVYRHPDDWPADWAAASNVLRFGDWYYVIGAQHIGDFPVP